MGIKGALLAGPPSLFDTNKIIKSKVKCGNTVCCGMEHEKWTEFQGRPTLVICFFPMIKSKKRSNKREFGNFKSVQDALKGIKKVLQAAED